MKLVVHVVTPSDREATDILHLLEESGIAAERCVDTLPTARSLAEQADAAEEATGALLLAAEALPGPDVKELAEAIRAQPEWSELPVFVLANEGARATLVASAEYTQLGAPLLLERPFRSGELVAQVRAALRDRERQFQMRDAFRENARSRSALVRNEKLAAVGRLAASISHEINNPLEAVTNLLYLVKKEDHLPEQALTYLLLAERELARVSQIAGQTLRFQRQAERPRPVAAEELIESVVALYQGRLMHANIKLEQRHRDAAAVTCHEGDIRQVLNNLVGNAIDSMRSGGRLLLRTGNAMCHRPELEGGAPVPGVRFTIADTGSGMSEETRAHLFDAFYTTKGVHGSGLGLWISHGIIERHHGRLDVRSSRRAGRTGTVFSVFLPAELHGAA